MVIDQFEILDLGIVPEGELLTWGASFRGFDCVVIGEGSSARQAIDDALNDLSLAGLDTSLLHEAAVEAGFYGVEASKHVSDIEPMEDLEADGDTLQQDEVTYLIGIRYNEPQ
jgi:hypothetical protein